ncbi:MAG: hypothetical protein CM15mP62_33690 [Rhodospirillaceae bacterium]|nr:MAG: hypothetical protein CM15mP62_33690 [Rhodospirillaceae bacterium]
MWFENCEVPADLIVGGQEGRGLKAALRGINHARFHVAATCVGQAIRLITEMTNMHLNVSSLENELVNLVK